MKVMAIKKDNSSSPDVSSPRRAPEFDVAIAHSLERVKQKSLVLWQQVQDNIRDPETACFGEMWYDAASGGLCPLDGTNGNKNCDIRQYCEGAYVEAQARIFARKEAALTSVLITVLPVKEKAKRSKFNIPAKIMRGKWNDTGKYQRTGYCAQNRPVDRALEQLVDVLGNPATLPKIWNPVNFNTKYGSLGKLVLSRTASYTSIIVDGQTVMRCWTNANNCMLVDVIGPLVLPLNSIKGLGKIILIPAGSVKKLRPCTHRFVLSFSSGLQLETIGAIGGFIRMFYKA